MIRHNSTGRGSNARIGIKNDPEGSGLRVCLLTIYLEVNIHIQAPHDDLADEEGGPT